MVCRSRGQFDFGVVLTRYQRAVVPGNGLARLPEEVRQRHEAGGEESVGLRVADGRQSQRAGVCEATVKICEQAREALPLVGAGEAPTLETDESDRIGVGGVLVVEDVSRLAGVLLSRARVDTEATFEGDEVDGARRALLRQAVADDDRRLVADARARVRLALTDVRQKREVFGARHDGLKQTLLHVNDRQLVFIALADFGRERREFD